MVNPEPTALRSRFFLATTTLGFSQTAKSACILMHAVSNGAAPTYIRDLVIPVNEISGRSHLRSATLGDFDVPRTRTKLGSRAFSVAGPVAWNSLPASIRELTSTNSFKRQPKTHLFRVAYEPAVYLFLCLILFMYSHIVRRRWPNYFVKGAIEVL